MVGRQVKGQGKQKAIMRSGNEPRSDKYRILINTKHGNHKRKNSKYPF